MTPDTFYSDHFWHYAKMLTSTLDHLDSETVARLETYFPELETRAKWLKDAEHERDSMRWAWEMMNR